MPIEPTYPGVYVEELPSSANAVTASPDAITAFVDFFPRGPAGRVSTLASFAAFQLQYGPLDPRSESSYQVLQFFLNGGAQALVLRLVSQDASSASATLLTATGASSRLGVTAENPGAWGNTLGVALIADPLHPDSEPTFSLLVQVHAGNGQTAASETFPGLCWDVASRRFCVDQVNAESMLIRLTDAPALGLPVIQPATADASATVFTSLGGGCDGTAASDSAPAPDSPSAPPAYPYTTSLLAALDPATSPLTSPDATPFHLLCLPATANLLAAEATLVMAAALTLCQAALAFYLVDIPSSLASPAQMLSWSSANQPTLNAAAGAVYYPQLSMPDPVTGQPRQVPSSGSIAGLYAANDRARGVWKAPAGTQAVLIGATPVHALTDAESTSLNSQAVNCIRVFPGHGALLWGARTLTGTDALADQNKYIPVQRFTLFIKQALMQIVGQLLFEPNGPALWAQIQLQAEGFFAGLFTRGALQGSTHQQAYFARCDASTNPAYDVANQLVTLTAGFATLRPEQFNILTVQQYKPDLPA